MLTNAPDYTVGTLACEACTGRRLSPNRPTPPPEGAGLRLSVEGEFDTVKRHPGPRRWHPITPNPSDP
jgi:hypothetical protein